MLLASMFGGIIGTRVPGAVYASQTIKFRAPVRVGASVRAEVRFESSLGGSAATFETKIFGEGGGGCRRNRGRDVAAEIRTRPPRVETTRVRTIRFPIIL